MNKEEWVEKKLKAKSFAGHHSWVTIRSEGAGTQPVKKINPGSSS